MQKIGLLDKTYVEHIDLCRLNCAEHARVKAYAEEKPAHDKDKLEYDVK